MLLEVLVSMLIFSVGVLGIIALQAASIKNEGASRYRTDASLLADELIGDMWADDRTPPGLAGDPYPLQVNYQGGPQNPPVDDGAGYSAWLQQVRQRLPGVTDNNTLPTVTVTYRNQSIPFDPLRGKSQVTVIMRWQLPGDSEVHNHVVVTEIK